MYEKGKLDYIVCNPVTREFRRLPRPHKAYHGVAVAFICKGNGATSLDDVRYEVIRAGINSRQLTTTLEMDTYSSVTGSWTEASVASDSPFLLLACNRSAFMVEEVTYWSAIESVVFDNRPSTRYAILAYDRVTENAQLIKMPVINGQRFASCGDILCPSEGKILYARHNFEKIERSEWKLEHRVTFVEINQQNCTNMSKSSSLISLEGFHPQNSQLLLLTWGLIPFWYNIESKKLMGVGGGFIWSCCQDYFPYEWPLTLEE
ncbi:hypothetical protein ACH5RR_030390 [Cinchona calisaya]|uniref:F-box protein At3g26010-like beta-propeller domain-containing protein n=1 Tax=Cinchona calisaya TaxID=153742 RepID=A0ABD2YUG3_9GENT